MTGFYKVLELIKWHFDNDPIVNTTTEGDIFEVDLNKQTIFPLVHLMTNNVSFETNVVRYNLSLIAMDVVNISKEATTDLFKGNSNEQDVLNTQLAVLNRCYDMMLHGDLWDLEFVVDGNPTCEPFTERFENFMAGWTMTFDVLIPNEMTICDTSSYEPFCPSATVVNSNGTYTASVLSGGTLTLPNETLNLQIDGVQVASSTYPPLSNQTINLIWQ
jgi:hypothetical protein